MTRRGLSALVPVRSAVLALAAQSGAQTPPAAELRQTASLKASDPGRDGSAQGVGSNQTDNPPGESGVYVFTR